MKCPVCSTETTGLGFTVREKMFGTLEEFRYFQCNHCEALFLSEKLKNPGKGYPDNYYSLSTKTKINGKLKRLLYKFILALLSTNAGKKFFSDDLKSPQNHWIYEIAPGYNNKILEVGCGNGQKLIKLYNWGFKNLFGVDPYIAQDKKIGDIELTKCELVDYTEKDFDLIIFNHSLEHIKDQLAALQIAGKLLKHEGDILIRTPVINRSFYIYKDNWVEIDAPRHVIIHSIKSLELLLREANLMIYKTIFDTDEFEFWGSEQFCMNIPTMSSNSYSIAPTKSIFSKKQMKHFRFLSMDYNKRGIAGRACFFLHKM